MSLKKNKGLESIFAAYPEIKLVYFFGSRATGRGSSTSDYDFAIYFDGIDKAAMYEIRFELFDTLSRYLKSDAIDIVILNLAESPELKFFIIKEGRLILEREPFKVIVEPNILNEYFDFQTGLLKYNLTRA